MGWLQEAGKKMLGSVDTGVGELADLVKDPVDGFENMGEELRRWRDNVRDLNPAGVSEELWGEAGRFAYASAAAIMAKRSPTGEPIARRYKEALRPFFSDTVDKVTIHWATPPLDEWAADRFKVKLEDIDTAAQTFGYDVYIKDPKGQNSAYDELGLLAHELVHSKQFEKYGRTYSNYGYHYFKEYKKANRDYAHNKLEREAYEEVNRIINQVYERWNLKWQGVSIEDIKPNRPLNISIGTDKTIVVAGNNNIAYRYLGGGRWTALEGHSISQLSVHNEQLIYALTPSNGIVRFNQTRWEGVGRRGISGNLQHIDIGTDGAVVAVANNSAYKYKGEGRWEELKGHSISQLSVHNEQLIYALTPSNGIVRFNQTRWEGVGRRGMSGNLQHIDIGTDGTVVAVANNSAYQYKGEGRWEELRGHSVAQVSVYDMFLIYALTPSNNVVRYI